MLGAIKPEKIAQIISGDPKIEAPPWNVAPKTSDKQPPNVVSDERPNGIVIGAVTDDQVAVDAARSVVDQLLHLGIPATVRTAKAAETLGSEVENGIVDGVVTWQRSPQAVSDYLVQYGCIKPLDQDDSSTPPSDTGASDPAEREEGSSEGASSPHRATGGNLSGTCDRDLQERLVKLGEGRGELSLERTQLDDRIAEMSTVLPIMSDRYTVVASDRLEGPTAGLEDWPLDDSSSLLISAPQWTLKPIEEVNRNAAENALEEN